MSGPILTRPPWDDYFMALAFVTAMRSPDPDTKHGSVLCDEHHRILGVGYNGFPHGVDDSTMPLTRPAKYGVIIHSEVNCLLHAKHPANPDRCVLYVTGHPCLECFKIIVQYGVRHVVYGGVQSQMIDADALKTIRFLATAAGVRLPPYCGGFIGLLEMALAYAQRRGLVSPVALWRLIGDRIVVAVKTAWNRFWRRA